MKPFLALVVFVAVLGNSSTVAVAQSAFIRGDTTADGKVDLADAVAGLGFLFLGATEPLCADAGDADDDGALTVGDSVYVLRHLFLQAAQPPTPGLLCGVDPTEDLLGCTYSPCSSALDHLVNFDDLVIDVETNECLKTDDELQREGLTEAQIDEVRTICALSSNEKRSYFTSEVMERQRAFEARRTPAGDGGGGTYTCFAAGINWGIPDYADVGVTLQTCQWTDPNPICHIKGEWSAFCLWGCTNRDPLLGSLLNQSFRDRAALERVILPKGYTRLIISSFDFYRRPLGFGYSYQLQGSEGTGQWYSEGPEPDLKFSWYAHFNGWWPVEVLAWHAKC